MSKTEFEVNEADIAAALRDAEKAGMERAVKIAARLENLWSDEWRVGSKTDQHLEGMSDGANAIWLAIRAAKETKE